MHTRRLAASRPRLHGRPCALYVCFICVPCMCALYVCLICMPYMYALYVCLRCMPYVYALYVRLTCMRYMYALYVCLMCMPYIHALHVSPAWWSGCRVQDVGCRMQGVECRVYCVRFKGALSALHTHAHTHRERARAPCTRGCQQPHSSCSHPKANAFVHAQVCVGKCAHKCPCQHAHASMYLRPHAQTHT